MHLTSLPQHKSCMSLFSYRNHRLTMCISTAMHSGTHSFLNGTASWSLFATFPLHCHLHQNFHHLVLFPQPWVLNDERSNLIFPVPCCNQLLFANNNRVVRIIWACTPKDFLHEVCTWSNMADKTFRIVYDLIAMLTRTFTAYMWPTRLKALKVKALSFRFCWTPHSSSFGILFKNLSETDMPTCLRSLGISNRRFSIRSCWEQERLSLFKINNLSSCVNDLWSQLKGFVNLYVMDHKHKWALAVHL